MEKINKGIVFSNDIEYILKGNNALDFNYEKKGIIVPTSSFIKNLRICFKNDVNKIFNGQVTILSEEEMLNGMYCSVADVVGRIPHNIIR